MTSEFYNIVRILRVLKNCVLINFLHCIVYCVWFLSVRFFFENKFCSTIHKMLQFKPCIVCHNKNYSSALSHTLVRNIASVLSCGIRIQEQKFVNYKFVLINSLLEITLACTKMKRSSPLKFTKLCNLQTIKQVILVFQHVCNIIYAHKVRYILFSHHLPVF